MPVPTINFAAIESWAIAASRIGLGAYFAVAGFGKVQGELTNGIGTFREGSFRGLQPGWLPDILATPYGIVLPWAEVLIGVTLAIGLFTRISAFLTFNMLASFTVALMMAKGLSGGGPVAFHSNVILAFVALMLIGTGGRVFAVDQLLSKVKSKPQTAPAQPVPAAS